MSGSNTGQVLPISFAKIAGTILTFVHNDQLFTISRTCHPRLKYWCSTKNLRIFANGEKKKKEMRKHVASYKLEFSETK